MLIVPILWGSGVLIDECEVIGVRGEVEECETAGERDEVVVSLEALRWWKIFMLLGDGLN